VNGVSVKNWIKLIEKTERRKKNLTSLINPYYAGIMKKRGVTADNLEIVEHFFIPTIEDLDRLTEGIKNCKEIVDIGSGYGLLINELAKRSPKIKFLGIDTMYWDKNFSLPKAEKNVKFKFTGIEAMTSKLFNTKKRTFDCVVCCWMPEGSDWREMLSTLAKKKVILILSKVGFATGTIETYCGMGQFGFELEKNWVSDKSIITIWRRI
jgi:2-polyprenyl-3-methyl-5-hydroxy-6-metoxy-1,4-benzoquinol methylase